MLVAYFTSVWIGSQIMAAAADAKKPLEVVDFATGDTSGEKKAQVMLVQTREQWAKAWIKNRQWPVVSNAPPPDDVADSIPDLPNIDFEKTEVVAVFGGMTNGMVGFTLDGVGIVDKHDVIRLVPQYMTATPGTSVVSLPFAFIQIIRGKRAMDVQVMSGNDQNGNPNWKTVASFAKPKSDGQKTTAGSS